MRSTNLTVGHGCYCHGVQVQDSAKDDKKIGALSIPLKFLLESTGMTLEQRYSLETEGVAANDEPSISLRLCLRVSYC